MVDGHVYIAVLGLHLLGSEMAGLNGSWFGCGGFDPRGWDDLQEWRFHNCWCVEGPSVCSIISHLPSSQNLKGMSASNRDIILESRGCSSECQCRQGA